MNTTTTQLKMNYYNLYFMDGENIKTPYVSQREIKRKIATDKNIIAEQVKFYAEGETEEIESGKEKDYMTDGVITLFVLIQNIRRFGDNDNMMEFTEYEGKDGETKTDIFDDLTLTDIEVLDGKLDFMLSFTKDDALTETNVRKYAIFDGVKCCEYITLMIAEEVDEDKYIIYDLALYADGTLKLIGENDGDADQVDDADIFL